MLLKSCLHPDMPFGLDIIGAFKDFTKLGWYFGDLLDTSFLANLFFQFLAVKVVLFSDFFENGIYLQQLVTI